MFFDAQTIIYVMVFIFGAITGSFLNVCVVRLPHEKSIVWPGSHCVHCQTPIRWSDNIPLLSWILLCGKCRSCSGQISFRYPLIELITALTFLGMSVYFGLNGVMAAYTVMMCGFIVATFVDLEHRIIPDEVSVGGMVAGFVFSVFFPELHGASSHLQGLGFSVLGALIGGGSIYSMGLIGDFVFKKETMGGGDVKLLAMIGAFLGWELAILTFFLAPFPGAVIGIIEKIRTGESTIAYGPFLVLGALASLFWGQDILHWIFTGYGLR